VFDEYVQSRYVYHIQMRRGMRIRNVASKHGIINVHTVLLPHRELELPRIPERRSFVQAGKDTFYSGPCVSILEPAPLNGPPQFVAESKLFRIFRFPRSDSFHDRIDG